MSKYYIDAEKLKVLVKRQIRWENLNFAALGSGGQTFCTNTLEWVLKQIDSLQQEFPTTDKSVEEFLATHPKVEVPEKYKTPDFVFKKQEQPSIPSNLDEAAEEYMKKARKHLFDDSPIGRADDAFKAGAEWAMQQLKGE